MPLVRLIAAVAYRVITPVGLTRLVVQVIGSVTIDPIVTVYSACAPRLVAYRAMVIAARAPTEQVAVNTHTIAVLSCCLTEIVPLVVGKLPVRRSGTSYVLQVALREVHLIAWAYREDTVDSTSRWRIVRKTLFASVARPLSVGGVSADIIRSRNKSRHGTSEAARACRGGHKLGASGGWVGAGAEIDASLGHRVAAVARHLSPAYGCGVGEVKLALTEAVITVGFCKAWVVKSFSSP